MQFKLVRPIFSAKRKKNPPVSALGVFYISISGTMKNKLIFPLKKIWSIFSLFFHSLFPTNSFSMSINWNVLLWNIGIFNKMDQSRCETWTLLTNNLVLFSVFPLIINFTTEKKSKKQTKKSTKNYEMIETLLNFFSTIRMIYIFILKAWLSVSRMSGGLAFDIVIFTVYLNLF